MDIYMVSEEDREGILSMLPDDVAEEEPVLFCAAKEEGEEKIPVGILAATITDNTWYLTHIVVEKKYRRQGIGRALISGLIDMARGTLADEISVEYNLNPKVNHGADAFFDAMGFTEVLRSNIYSVHILYIETGLNKVVKKIPKGNYLSLKDVTNRQWEEMRGRLIAAGESYNPSPDTPVFERRLFIDPGRRADYDQDVSSVVLEDDGSIVGCVLLSQKDYGVVLNYMCTLSETPNAMLGLMGGLFKTYESALQKYGDNYNLFVNTQNKMSESLFLKLAIGREKLYGVVVERELSLC